METIGVILMVGGFILGVFAGLTMSRREVLLNDRDDLKKDKQFMLSIIAGAAAMIMLVGFVFFFGGF